MKQAVILPTRGKPDMLRTVVMAFQHLESTENDVRYFVRIDEDERQIYADIIEKPLNRVECLVKSAPLTPAEKSLDIINSVAFKDFDPDVHVLMSDDVLPLSYCWDGIITKAIELGHLAFCWQEAADPHNQTYIILAKKYVEAMPSYLTTWFPFWFSDMWRNEVHRMVFGRSMFIVENLKLGGKRGKTHGFSDAAFWFNFFARTRIDRWNEARQLANNLGVAFDEGSIQWDGFKKWDEFQKGRFYYYETRFGGNHSHNYLQAKKRAENYLLHNNLL